MEPWILAKWRESCPGEWVMGWFSMGDNIGIMGVLNVRSFWTVRQVRTRGRCDLYWLMITVIQWQICQISSSVGKIFDHYWISGCVKIHNLSYYQRIIFSREIITSVDCRHEIQPNLSFKFQVNPQKVPDSSGVHYQHSACISHVLSAASQRVSLHVVSRAQSWQQQNSNPAGCFKQLWRQS